MENKYMDDYFHMLNDARKHGTRDLEVFLGIGIGCVLKNQLSHIPTDEIMLVSLPDEIDYIGKGIELGLGRTLPISVYWLSVCFFGYDSIYPDECVGETVIAPIIKSYEEPIEKCDTLIIAMATLSSSLIIKTLLTRLVDKLQPRRIIIATPMMYKRVQSDLMDSFPSKIVEKIEFISSTMNENDDVDDTYSRINNSRTYMPSIIKDRMDLNTKQS